MQDLDWTAIITQLLGGSSILTVVVLFALRSRSAHKRSDSRLHREDELFEAADSPATRGDDFREISTASKALDQASRAWNRMDDMERRFEELKGELDEVRRSYRALYSWSRDLVNRWHIHRQRDRPPPLPDDIHHPD